MALLSQDEEDERKGEAELTRPVASLVGATAILDYLGSTARCTLLRVIALTDPQQRSLMVACGG